MFLRIALTAAFVGLEIVTRVATNQAYAAELIVAVKEVKSLRGEVGCALYPSERGFPLDNSAARVIWQRPGQPNSPNTTCRFDSLPGGNYAVAVSHDLNGNRQTDTNFLGIPTEDWGVSNNIRSFLRPPTFAEAALTLAPDEVKEISVEIDH